MCRWLEKNLPNLILPLHRFCVHTLTTVYRTIDSELNQPTPLEQFQAAVAAEANKENPLSMALNRDLRRLHEPSVSMNERSSIPELVTGNTLPTSGGLGNLMSLSQSWLLAAALPNVFTRLQDRKVSNTVQPTSSERSDVNTNFFFGLFHANYFGRLPKCQMLNLIDF